MDFNITYFFRLGIIPNSFAHIFGHIAKADDNIKFLVRVSYLEIYNEEVRDLLGKDQSLRLEVKERPGKKITFKSFDFSCRTLKLLNIKPFHRIKNLYLLTDF